MDIFGRAFWGAAYGKLAITIILAVLAALGLGVDFWVHGLLNWWGANPANATITILRIAGAAFGVLCLGIIAYPYALAAFRPRKFFVTFNSDRDVDRAIAQFHLQTGARLPNRTTYAHVHVEAIGAHITPCTGAIIALEKLDDKKTVISRLVGTRSLIWCPREHNQLRQTIAPHLPQDLDLFRTVEGVNKLEVLSSGHPQTWFDFFDLPGRYRIAVAVHGGEQTATIYRSPWSPQTVTPCANPR
jgi:hypothetical protein